MKSDVNRLVDADEVQNKLGAATVPPTMRAKTATAKSGAGSIASPLTETTATRVYYTERTAASSDGVFTFKYKPIQSISFVDANGSPVVFNLAEPPP